MVWATPRSSRSRPEIQGHQRRAEVARISKRKHEPLVNPTRWLSRTYYISDSCREKRPMVRFHKGKLKSIWMKVNGASMHARLSENSVPPTASTVVLVHGLSVSSGYMVPTAVRLAAYYHVYLPDLPGFGKSAKPSHILTVAELADALADWMQAMGLPPAVLLGNSMGCQIIVNFALKYPERITHAVLVAPTMDPKVRSISQAALRLALDMPCEPLSFLPVLVREYLAAGLRRTLRTLQY